jgi:hypothetical protein
MGKLHGYRGHEIDLGIRRWLSHLCNKALISTQCMTIARFGPLQKRDVCTCQTSRPGLLCSINEGPVI